jgi:O-antigen ligase
VLARAVALTAAFCVAAALPSLLAYNPPPSPTTLNQATAIGAWGMVVLLLSAHGAGTAAWRDAVARSAAPMVALLIIALAALLSLGLRGLPAGLAVSAAGALGLAAAALAVGAAATPGVPMWAALFAAWVVAGFAGVLIGLVQVFAPDTADGQWIARANMAGRAVGNLRQPNHLATLLLWSTVAVVPLMEMASRRRTVITAALGALFATMLFGVVLSGSRTGLLGVAVLAVWGLLDRRLSLTARALLIASPLICLASGMLLGWLSSILDAGAIGAATRFGQSQDYSSGRWSIWRDTLSLIAQNPWAGVGFGEFNFAWTLTPFPTRGGEFFDHTHNLLLHLAVELGVPLALLAAGLLALGLWQAYRRSVTATDVNGVARRSAFAMVLLMAVHSQLEYPLWYAYFLLPTTLMWGLCLQWPASGFAPSPASRGPSTWMLVAGLAMLLAAAITLWDYQRVVAIFAPRQDNHASLAERISEGRHSWFFAHHADYALVTTIDGAAALPGAFDRSAHFLLDTRLMMAWAQGLAARGDVDAARYIAARLREFRNPGAKDFFAPCDDASVTDKPFQCQPPERAYSWRDFLAKK